MNRFLLFLTFISFFSAPVQNAGAQTNQFAVNAHRQAYLTTEPTIRATDASPVGTNPISASGAVGPNYSSSNLPGTLNRLASSAATLSNLTISPGTLAPAFAPGTISYIAGVPNAASSVTVTPTLTDLTAKVTVNGTSVASGLASGPVSLNVGVNTITTVVTAQDGTTKNTYTITVTRSPSYGASLSNLTISPGTLAPAFATGTTSYTASVANTVSNVTVTPKLTDPTATITVNGTAVASGSASGPVALNVGVNTITTVVTAQDGTTKGTYTITVTRSPSYGASLSNLTISPGTLAPAFVTGTTSSIRQALQTQ